MRIWLALGFGLLVTLAGCAQSTTSSPVSAATPITTLLATVVAPTPSPRGVEPTSTPVPIATSTATLVPTQVLASPVATPTPRPWVTEYFDLALANAKTAWLIGKSCPPWDPRADIPGSVFIQSDKSPSCLGLVEQTVDGGKDWTREHLANPHLIPQAIQFVDPRHGWLTTASGPVCGPGCTTSIFRTTDGGRHWELTYHQSWPNPKAVTPTPGSILPYFGFTQLAFTSVNDGWAFGGACDDSSGRSVCKPILLITHNGGISWQSSPLAVALGKSSMASLTHPTTADGWIAATEGGSPVVRLIVTHDGGRTWQRLTDPEGGAFIYPLISFVNARQGWLLARGQPATIQEPKLLYATSDGGTTWKVISSTWLPGNRKSKIQGQLPMDGYALGLDFSSAKVGWLQLARTGLFRTTDGGRDWVPDSMGQVDAYTATHFVNPRDGWALQLRDLWSTTDQGKTWRRVPFPRDVAAP